MENVDCVTIKLNRYASFIAAYLILGTLFMFIIGIKFKLENLSFVWLFVFFSAPLFFESSFRKKFVNNASVTFSDTSLHIETFDRETDGLEKTDTFLYSDIKSFKAVDPVKNDFSRLKIYLKSGESRSYVFTGQTYKNDSCINDLVFKYFNMYNDSLTDKSEKIQLNPNLYATKTGKFLIIGLTVLLIVDIVYQLLYTKITIRPTLILGVSLYFVILMQMIKANQQKKLLH